LLLDPKATENSAAVSVDELITTGVAKDVTAPIEVAMLKMNLSPGSRVAGTAAPLDAIVNTIEVDWPAAIKVGFTAKVTLLLAWGDTARIVGVAAPSISTIKHIMATMRINRSPERCISNVKGFHQAFHRSGSGNSGYAHTAARGDPLLPVTICWVRESQGPNNYITRVKHSARVVRDMDVSLK
jgi:hypothetical protein